MTPPNPDKTQLPLATLGVRTLAFIIDAVIILVVFVAVAVAISPTVGFLYDFLYGPPEWESLAYFFFAWFVAIFLVTVLVLIIWGGMFEGIRGRTPGKAALDLKVVSAEDHNQTIGFTRGIIRQIIRSLPAILFSFPVIFFNRYTLFYPVTFEQFLVMFLLLSVLVFVLDHLWALWDKEKQALHDKIAKSHVISKEIWITDHKIVNKIYTILRRMGLG